MHSKWLQCSRWLPLLLLIGLFIIFFYFGWYKYLSFESLKQNRDLLIHWTLNHYLISLLIFNLIYILSVAISIPGAIFLTLAGGFLFGIFFGTIYVVFSATIGATLLFLAVRLALGKWISHKAKGWKGKMQAGFEQNAFNYLLILRLIPIFPFWIVNIVPALLRVPTRTFILATFIGIIPGSLVYVSIGNGLNSLFIQNKTPNLSIIFSPQIILPLIGLAILSLIPVIYKKYKSKKNEN